MDSQKSKALVEVNNLTVSFGKLTVLSNIHLSIFPSQIVTLVGPNGAGKSTLIKAILGFIPDYTGSIQMQKGITLGYMPQQMKVDPLIPITVKRFLELGQIMASSTRESDVALENILEELAIQHLAQTALQNVSGGELQRILLARALLRNPRLLVLDEPAQGVDINGQEELYRLIAKISNKRHCSVLMVSHDLHLVMAETDIVICLNKHICCSGRPEIVTQQPEFLNLFGLEKGLAIYSHRHDHKHNLGGEVCKDS